MMELLKAFGGGTIKEYDSLFLLYLLEIVEGYRVEVWAVLGKVSM